MRRRISRSEWAIRRLRLPTSQDTGLEPGLLLVQIDGLSRRQMERAMQRGRLRFLRSLIRREHYEATTFYSGIPSSTPAVQAELYYGMSCAVPAFSFLSREERRITTMYNPETAKAVETRLRECDTGLLEGGSSWSNIFTGGATVDESHFCAASLGPGDIFKAGTLVNLIGFVVLNIPALLRLIGLAVIEFGVALYDSIRGVLRGEPAGNEFLFIFSRMFVCISLREVVVVGGKIDLTRGLPIVHVNFLGFDEQAHRRGPSSAFAHWSLKGIDGAIERLYRAARQSGRRDYQVWIFSDHGQEAARPFSEVRPEGLEAVVGESLAHFRERPPHAGQRKQERVSHAVLAGGRVARRRLEEWSRTEPLTQHEEASFSIAAMGPVGHLYLADPLSVDEKRQFAEHLVRHGQVPGVLFPTGPGKAEWIHSGGTVKLPKDGSSFFPYPADLGQEVVRDLLRLCRHESSGDVLLMGWLPGARTWSFPEEHGAHAGPGPEETQGFLLVPPKTRLPRPERTFVRPSDLRAAALHYLGRQAIAAPVRMVQRHPHNLRVMTYNIHSCVGMDGRCSPLRIARLIDMFDPDVVALQEIDFGHSRSQGLDQAGIIAGELNMHTLFCPTVIDGNEHYGHAVLSRYPLELVRADNLAGGRGGLLNEPRGALWAKIRAGDLLIHLLNTHFGLSRNERLAQVGDLLGQGWIGAIPADEPIILCGDFNTFPDSMPHRALTVRLHDVQVDARRNNIHFRPLNTFSAFHPFCRIDHIFISHHFRAENAFVPRNYLTRVASDHLPLVADLVVRESQVKSSEEAVSADGEQEQEFYQSRANPSEGR